MRRTGASATAPWCAALALVLFAAAPARADGGGATYRDAIGVELSSGFVPYANDVPLSASLVVRIADAHEPWLRAGVMLTGDDARRGLVLAGYRVALRPRETWRPLLGGFGGLITDTCGHDDRGRRTCTGAPLGLFAAMGGVRAEPLPWLGVALQLALGLDTLGNPFGFVEIGLEARLPLS